MEMWRRKLVSRVVREILISGGFRRCVAMVFLINKLRESCAVLG